MAADLPAPLVPPDCDLRDFPKIMIDVGRIFASSFNASTSTNPWAWMVGHKLWYRSWHQVPAASLPDSDAELCHLAELGGATSKFKAIRPQAMRGWVKCSDGRLYHPVVAAEALEAWIKKLNQRIVSAKGNAKKYNSTFDERPLQAQINVAVMMLAALNPQSKTVLKARGKGSPNTPDGTPDGSAPGLPQGSQETETGTGRGNNPSQEKGADVVQLASARGASA